MTVAFACAGVNGWVGGADVVGVVVVAVDVPGVVSDARVVGGGEAVGWPVLAELQPASRAMDAAATASARGRNRRRHFTTNGVRSVSGGQCADVSADAQAWRSSARASEALINSRPAGSQPA